MFARKGVLVSDKEVLVCPIRKCLVCLIKGYLVCLIKGYLSDKGVLVCLIRGVGMSDKECGCP